MPTKVYRTDSDQMKWIRETSEKARQLIIEAVEARTSDSKTRLDCVDEVMGHLTTAYIVARSNGGVMEAARLTAAFQNYLTGSVPMMLLDAMGKKQV